MRPPSPPTTRKRLIGQLERSPITTPGRRILGTLLSDDPVTPTESALEARAWRRLREAGLPRPERQYEIRNANRRVVARVDFAYPRVKLAIEADGYRFHSSRTQWRRDIARQNALLELGWLVVRATWEDATRVDGAFAARIAALLVLRGKG
jgi:very-short-patch-repair endonuclease